METGKETEQTAGFQSFGMRTFNVRGNWRLHKKVDSFMTLKPLGSAVKGCALPSPKQLRAGRSKAFSPVCLSRFLEFPALIPVTTQPLEERVE
jgi:hypothetical protein